MMSRTMLILSPPWDSGGVHCGMDDLFFTAGILQAADEKRTLLRNEKRRLGQEANP
jgi:hypothetical protein